MENQVCLKQKVGFATIAIHSGQESEHWNSAAVVPPMVTSTTFKQLAPAHTMENQGCLKQKVGFATIAIHSGQESEHWNSAAVVPPVVTSTTFKQLAPAEHTMENQGLLKQKVSFATIAIPSAQEPENWKSATEVLPIVTSTSTTFKQLAPAEHTMENQGFLKQKVGFATIAIHAGQEPEKWKSAAVVPPIVTSTIFKQLAPAEHTGFVYGRSGNPSRNTLEECLAALDGGKHGVAFASGIAVTSTLMGLLSSGDHVISNDDFYCGTNRLFRQVSSRQGIEITFPDFTKLENIEAAIKKNTKMIWLETPTNPLLKMVDIAAVVKIAKSKGDILVVVDNTFLTSYLQRPLDFGADVVMYSITKYMNGHSDVIMGAAVVNNDELSVKLRFLQKAMGAVPSPFDCYLVNRSLKTLALRMERHKESSLVLAKWLLEHPKVTEVMHPGLPSHPQHDIAKKQTSGHSGVFSFKHVGDLKESRKFLSSLKVFTLAESLGGYKSLAQLPSLMTHTSVPAEKRIELGITDSLIRLSVGLEDVQDLIDDLTQAFDVAF